MNCTNELLAAVPERNGMSVCTRPGLDARRCYIRRDCRHGHGNIHSRVSLTDKPKRAPGAELLVAGGSSEAVPGPRADHATPGPSAPVLRHACVGVTGTSVPRHVREVSVGRGDRRYCGPSANSQKSVGTVVF